MSVNDDGVLELQPDSAIRRAAREIEAHVGEAGWDQPARLFALVPTADLIAREPQLAEQLTLDEDGGGLTSIEQDGAAADRPIEDLLGEIEWPDAVAGCAVVIERLMLPPDAEATLPDDPDAAVEAAAEHPDRRDVRLVAAVLRSGEAHSAVRGREPDDAPLLEGPDLVPGLVARLIGTFDS